MAGQRADSGETIMAEGGKFGAVGMSSVCALGVDQDINLLEPDTTGTGANYRREEYVPWQARKRRAVWVHEIGHTIYPNYLKDWFLLWNTREGPRQDSAPTGYAKKSREEDFCESFMLFVLYGGRRLNEERQKFFASRPELVRVAQAATQPTAASASSPTAGAGSAASATAASGPKTG